MNKIYLFTFMVSFHSLSLTLNNYT